MSRSAASAALAFVLLVALGTSPAQAAKSGGSSAPVPAGMTVQAENLYQPYAWQDPGVFGVDDFMNWTVTGQLAPGEAYTYVPKWPIGSASEVPAMSSSLRWSGATQLRLTTVVPMNDQASAADPRVDHRGATITAPVVNNSAALCMFFVPSNSVPTFNYALRITNVGGATATSVTFTGQTSNGYTSNFGQFCNRADADGDGWNDTLEEGMANLTAPAVDSGDDALRVFGTDYLGSRPMTCGADDEVDSYPPDVNDDGAVNQADVDEIAGWVGQGSGVPQARVEYTGVGAYAYQQQSGLWRRYDLTGDGLVTSADVAWVRAEVGRPVPDPADLLAPAVSYDRSAGTAFPRRTAVWLGAFARDNRALASIRFAVNGTTLTQQCTDPATEMADPAWYRNPATAQYQCVWTTPGKAATVTLTVTATDAAGNSTVEKVQLTVT
jgi:hypothetical protein